MWGTGGGAHPSKQCRIKLVGGGNKKIDKHKRKKKQKKPLDPPLRSVRILGMKFKCLFVSNLSCNNLVFAYFKTREGDSKRRVS